MLRVIIILIAFTLKMISSAAAATIYVPDDYPTIQGAINAAVDMDTIIVRPGTYVENIDFCRKAITVVSEKGPAATTIDGNRAGSVAFFHSREGAGSILDGFSLVNGGNSPGCGVFCSNSSPVIVNNVIKGFPGQSGSGIYCFDSSPTISNNTITENFHAAVICDAYSAPVITGNTISNNECGIYLNCSSLPLIEENVIADNTGSAIICDKKCAAVISRNIITGNSAGTGGAVYCEGSSPDILGNVIIGNSAPVASAVMCASGSAPVISGNVIIGNQSTDGTVCCYWGSDALISGNVIMGNTAALGAGIICHQSAPMITSCVIAGNAAAAAGGGIYCYDAVPSIVNTTLTGNTSLGYGGGIACEVKSSPVVTNAVIWNNSALSGAEIYVSSSGSPVVTFSDVKGGWPGTGNIDADPLFAGAADGDFHLTFQSPCRDTGDSGAVTEPFDFEGDPRIAGGSADMGADEFYYHLYHIGDVISGGSIDVKVVGTPSAPVTLALGSGIVDPPRVTPYGDLYLAFPLMRFKIGSIPLNGVLVYPGTVPGFWNPGDIKPLQALIGPLGNPNSVLTNLMVLTVE